MKDTEHDCARAHSHGEHQCAQYSESRIAPQRAKRLPDLGANIAECNAQAHVPHLFLNQAGGTEFQSGRAACLLGGESRLLLLILQQLLIGAGARYPGRDPLPTGGAGCATWS